MLGIHDYPLFVATGVLLNLTPGQDTFYILGRSLSGGARHGVAAALGIAAGCVVHTVAAAAGLAALLAASPLAFDVIRYAGAAYLAWLGARMLLTPPARATLQESSQTSLREAFTQGAVTNLLNPKVALFILALLPQFIAPDSPAKTAAFLVLGATFITTGLSWCLVLALGAGRLGAWLRNRPSAGRWLERAAGGLFIALAARLAATR